MKMTTNRIANRIQFVLASPKMPVKITTRRIELTTLPMTCHGLNLPHFVWVLSTMLPITGSDDHDKSGNQTDQFVGNAFFDAVKHAAGHENDKVGAQCAIKSGVTQISKCECNSFAPFP